MCGATLSVKLSTSFDEEMLLSYEFTRAGGLFERVSRPHTSAGSMGSVP